MKDLYEQITESLRDLTPEDIYGSKYSDEVTFEECMENGDIDYAIKDLPRPVWK